MWVIIEPIVAFIAKILAEFLVDKIKSAFDFIMASIDALIEIFDGFSKFFSSIFAGDMDGAVEGLKQIFSGFLNFFTATWDYALDGIKNFVGMLLNIFDNLFGTNLKEYADMIFDWVFGWTDVVRSVITGVFDGIVDNIKHGIEGLVSVFTGFGDMIKQLFAGDIVGAAMSFIDIIKTIINMPIHFINDIVITPLKSVLAAVSDAVDKIPAVDNPHWEESISYIPTLHGGGYIGGHGDQQINGEGGEWMLSRTDVRRMGGIAGVQSARMGGGGGTTNNYFSVTAKVSSDFDIDQLAKKLSRKMEQQAQRRGKF